ncbi:MAG: sigma-70 family RNA polymerase sigma factor [Planctomycetia bacterium]|nr:sigma-70 family RNA polymerase sigma factor [Planctomycetia bacterium]
MASSKYRRPSDMILIQTTRDFFRASLKGKVDDPQLLGAWRRFYEWYDPLIRRFAVSCGMRGGTLDDVVQSAWTIVIRDLEKFDCDPSRGSFRAWLYARVRNVSVDQIRARTRRVEYCAGVQSGLCSDPALEPTRMFEQQWNEAVLHEALSVLERFVSDLDFKLFVMRRFHDVSITELSQDTGRCESTVRSKLQRTMKAFATIIDQRGYGDLLFDCDEM